jgi:hypothetical protein
MIGTAGNPAARKLPHFYCSSYKAYMGRDNPTGCGKNNAPAGILDDLVQQYLARATVTAETLVAAEKNPALLKPFLERYWAEQEHFLSAHRHMRAFIADALADGEHDLRVTDGRPTRVVVEGDSVKVQDEGVTVFDVYHHLFTMNRDTTINRIADLERRREDLYERMKTYKSGYARQRADEEMDDLGRQIDELRAGLERQDVAARDSHRRLLAVQAELAEARKALAGNSLRRKAEAVRKVVGRIVCHFRAVDRGTRRNAPTEELTQVDILPAAGTGLKLQVCDSSDIARAGRRWRAACRSGPPATSPRSRRSACRRPKPCR